jgi:hypothetical protein
VVVVFGMRSTIGELSDEELSDEKLEKRLITDDGFFSRCVLGSWNTAGLIAMGDCGEMGL